MPLYEFIVEGTGEVIEEILPWPPPEVLRSSTGRVARRKPVSLIANTPGLFGDSPIVSRHGVNGMFDRGLGIHYTTTRERDRIGAERGLVNHEQLGSPAEADRIFDTMLDREDTEHEGLSQEMALYDANLAKYDGDVERAQTETWSIGRMQSGEVAPQLMPRED